MRSRLLRRLFRRLLDCEFSSPFHSHQSSFHFRLVTTHSNRPSQPHQPHRRLQVHILRRHPLRRPRHRPPNPPPHSKHPRRPPRNVPSLQRNRHRHLGHLCPTRGNGIRLPSRSSR